jgi:hypothetical protein
MGIFFEKWAKCFKILAEIVICSGQMCRDWKNDPNFENMNKNLIN